MTYNKKIVLDAKREGEGGEKKKKKRAPRVSSF